MVVLRVRSGRWSALVRGVAGALSVLVLSACGGGGGGGAEGGAGVSPPTSPAPTPTPNPPVAAAPTSTQITLDSDPGDSIGQGRAYAYTQANANIQVSLQAGRVSVVLTGDEDWQGDFQIPTNLTPGVARYDAVPRYPQAVTTQPSMRWFGGGRGCATSTGWFSIDHITLASGGAATALILRFERRCDGVAAALRGEVRWRADDATRPPAIEQPPPATLWRPPAGATPASGNYVYMQSEAGDYVGQGRSALYTPRNALMSAHGASDYFEVTINGAQRWYGLVQGRRDTVSIQPGYYADMTRYPFINPTRGGLAWVNDGRGCEDQRGWMVVDEVSYGPDRVVIADIAYRFEQRCVGSAAVLRGAVRWRAADAAPPGTPSPSPAPGTWQPPAGALPASGTAFYLDSEPGDHIGKGVERVFTPLNAVIAVEENAGRLSIGIDGVFGWRADLRTEAAPSTVRPGVYSDLPRAFPPVNDDLPHFSLTGLSAGCGESKAWVAVDAAEYSEGRLSALDLRLEQRCAGAVGALRGRLRWRADDLRTLPGPAPIVPKPEWRALTGAVPTAGNFLLINSTRSDIVGGGERLLYTPADAQFKPQVEGNKLSLQVLGDDTWNLVFEGIAGQPLLTPGTYAGVGEHPFHPLPRGGMRVWRLGWPTGSLQGNFIIDRIEHDAQGQLTALLMRFEQHTSPSTPGSLWGELRWSADDTSLPTGPVSPAPAGLWAPPAGAPPATGSYLYFESGSGDFIGEGRTQLLVPPTAQLSVAPSDTAVARPGEIVLTAKVNTSAFEPWTLRLAPMAGRSRLEPGYYEVPFAYWFQNPAKGGMAFRGEGRGCNLNGGWFVVDSVGYSGDTLTAIKVRFEQYCDSDNPLRGEFVIRP